MVFETSVDKPAQRAAIAVAAVALLALLLFNLASDFIVGTLTDERVKVRRDILAASADHFSGSPRLHAKLAKASLTEPGGDLARAESHALRAIALSPYDYRFPLILASIKESTGDDDAAEQSLRWSLAVAPNNADVRWHLANLLLRKGNLAQSIDEFRRAVASRSAFLPIAFDLIWKASGGDLSAVEAVAGDEPKAKTALARFLLTQSRVMEAARVFRSLDRSVWIASPETSAFIDGLIAAGRFELARELWLDLKAATNADRSPVWNGGFESVPPRELGQFDWIINRSDYARFAFDEGAYHNGNRSFRIDFIGRDLPRLDEEIKQLIVVRSGARYRIECYVKTAQLDTPEGPRIVVAAGGSQPWLATSEPVRAGTSDWQLLAVDFVAPENISGNGLALYVSIKRKPQSDYEAPTRGTVWFDDFTMREM